jgi:hypothetical protein
MSAPNRATSPPNGQGGRKEWNEKADNWPLCTDSGRPGEMQVTADLYLQGKIDQWYSLQGRPGVVFILNVTDPAMAKEMLEALPLGREHLMSFELVPLGPLTPLRQLLPAHPQ